MVPEHTIDRIFEKFSEEESAYEKALAGLEENQPIMLPFLFSENFELLTLREREYMLFLTLVVWQSILQEYGSVPTLTPEDLSKAEEHNWSLVKDVKARRFHERLDPFFEDSSQEDLLAFVEDALSEEDEWVTREGREPIFITLKSIIDCLAP